MAIYLAEGLLEEYRENKDVRLVVTHTHEHALYINHIFFNKTSQHTVTRKQILKFFYFSSTLSLSTYKHFDVYSPDRDVLVILMDLASRGYTGPTTNMLGRRVPLSLLISWIEFKASVKVIQRSRKQVCWYNQKHMV